MRGARRIGPPELTTSGSGGCADGNTWPPKSGLDGTGGSVRSGGTSWSTGGASPRSESRSGRGSVRQPPVAASSAASRTLRGFTMYPARMKFLFEAIIGARVAVILSVGGLRAVGVTAIVVHPLLEVLVGDGAAADAPDGGVGLVVDGV